MSNYNTGNPVPSIDPRDLDDNATNFDLLLNEAVPSVNDRLGGPRKTWWQMEQDAAALVSPNVSSLAGLTLSANKGMYATGASALAVYDLSSLGRTLGGIASEAAGRTALAAAASGANSDILSLSGLTTALSIAQGGTGNATGLAATATALATSRSISTTGDATWTVNFNGTANATAALTLAASGVGAGTYGSVTVNAKGLVTAASTATPVANGGTGATDAATARTNLGLGTVAIESTVPVSKGGTNSTTAAGARTSLGVLAASDKPAWGSYTPTVTPGTSGTYTTVTSTGKYIVLYGVCHFQASFTITTVGTGTGPTIVSLPVAALAGSVDMPIPAVENGLTGRTGTARTLADLVTALIADYSGAAIVTGSGAKVFVQGSYPVA